MVEDEESLLTAISQKMNHNNIDSRCAKSVEEAREVLKNFHPNLVWLDHYLLGNSDGLELVRFLKRNKKLKNIPIFIVTNTCTDEKYNEYMGLGIEKYYIKSSVRLDEIIADVKGACIAYQN